MGLDHAGPKDPVGERNGQTVTRKDLVVIEKMQLTACFEDIRSLQLSFDRVEVCDRELATLVCLWPVTTHSLNILGF